jgi:hypothetical protein
MLEGIAVVDRGAEVIAIAIVVAMLVFFVWLYFSPRYTITSQAMLVKAGPFPGSWRSERSPLSSRRAIGHPALRSL